MSNETSLKTERYKCGHCYIKFWYTKSYNNQIPRCPKCNSVNNIYKIETESFFDRIKRILGL